MSALFVCWLVLFCFWRVVRSTSLLSLWRALNFLVYCCGVLAIVTLRWVLVTLLCLSAIHILLACSLNALYTPLPCTHPLESRRSSHPANLPPALPSSRKQQTSSAKLPLGNFCVSCYFCWHCWCSKIVRPLHSAALCCFCFISSRWRCDYSAVAH